MRTMINYTTVRNETKGLDADGLAAFMAGTQWVLEPHVRGHWALKHRGWPILSLTARRVSDQMVKLMLLRKTVKVLWGTDLIVSASTAEHTTG